MKPRCSPSWGPQRPWAERFSTEECGSCLSRLVRWTPSSRKVFTRSIRSCQSKPGRSVLSTNYSAGSLGEAPLDLARRFYTKPICLDVLKSRISQLHAVSAPCETRIWVKWILSAGFLFLSQWWERDSLGCPCKQRAARGGCAALRVFAWRAHSFLLSALRRWTVSPCVLFRESCSSCGCSHTLISIVPHLRSWACLRLWSSDSRGQGVEFRFSMPLERAWHRYRWIMGNARFSDHGVYPSVGRLCHGCSVLLELYMERHKDKRFLKTEWSNLGESGYICPVGYNVT